MYVCRYVEGEGEREREITYNQTILHSEKRPKTLPGSNYGGKPRACT